MGKISAVQQSYLENLFGSRVSFHRIERKLYGHDVAALPGLLKPVVGSTTPDAVVQPENQDELVSLVRWAHAENIPLTPRGKATSGYGGALPVKKGVVIDFRRLNRILSVNEQAQIATVESGIIWEKFDKELAKHGLTLRLYPTSYPGSTVGGWLAQGGAGIGSYEAGWFKDNVLSARAVMPDGKVREFIGPELDLIADAEGITGLITDVTLSLQRLDELEIKALAFLDAENLQRFTEALVAEKLPIWSFLFANPKMAELKNKAPLSEHYGIPEKQVLLPTKFIATLAFRKKDSYSVSFKLAAFAKTCGAEILSDEIAGHEWANRFKVMLVKRLGPSLTAVDFVIPLAALSQVMTEVTRMVDQPIVKEGVVIRNGVNGRPEVVILGFIPSDQRKFSYNLVFGLALTILKIAAKYGGRPYSTGLHFASKANEILGVKRVEQLRSFKTKIDPRNIFNPGKVIAGGVSGAFLSLSGFLEPVIRLMGNRVVVNVSERPVKAVKGIPADVAWYAYGCSQCGYCVEECDQFYGRGWESQSPRGKWYWLREYMEGREKWDQFMVDSILSCTTCDLCNKRCSVSLPIEASWMKLRGQLVQDQKKMTFPPFEMMTAALQSEGDIWAGYRKDRGNWFPTDLAEKHSLPHCAKAVYFAGCTASYVEKDIALASVRLLESAGIDFTYLSENENCCGTPMLVAGKWEVFVETMKKNIAAVERAGADTVISSCPACDMMWRQVYPKWAKKIGMEYNIKARHYSEVIAEKLKSGEFVFPTNGNEACTVTWHDSCHMGRVSGIYEPPRELIQSLPGVKFVEMEYNREEAHCCGSVLTLIKEPAVAADVGKIRLDEAVDVGAEKILALCPCCEFQLRVSADKKQSPVEVVDLARFAASRMGYDFPDPNPEVQKQWAVFEAMIALMTPEGFAALMCTMWPEMIDAMPFGMGRMMRAMGKIPGSLELMKPMFPVLFPRLLPMMMPKVMPVMLQRVSERIPMPDYMAEQMPALMPKVMDNLMPHMIGDVVPLVTGPMIEYLRGK